MYAQIVTIGLCLTTLAIASPIPNNPINSTIANIESYFDNLAQSLISRREVNSTEKFQTADGHTQIAIQPVGATTLQDILFHPTNQHLVAEKETELFSNATNEVHLAKVDLVTESTTEHRETSESTTKSPGSTAASHESTEAAPNSTVSTTTVQILKAIPTTVVTGTTESTTVADLSTKAISSTVTDTSSSTTVSTPLSTPLVEIVTPVDAAANGTTISTTTSKPISSSTTVRTSSSTEHVEIVTPVNAEVANRNATTTAEPESESKEIRDKVKEVQAEPVILTVGV